MFVKRNSNIDVNEYSNTSKNIHPVKGYVFSDFIKLPSGWQLMYLQVTNHCQLRQSHLIITAMYIKAKTQYIALPGIPYHKTCKYCHYLEEVTNVTFDAAFSYIYTFSTLPLCLNSAVTLLHDMLVFLEVSDIGSMMLHMSNKSPIKPSFLRGCTSSIMFNNKKESYKNINCKN